MEKVNTNSTFPCKNEVSEARRTITHTLYIKLQPFFFPKEIVDFKEGMFLFNESFLQVSLTFLIALTKNQDSYLHDESKITWWN